MTGRVLSVQISERRGERKRPVPEIRLVPRHGIVGDAHAGDWHRQISLLAQESVDAMEAPVPLDPGIFAENVRTEGIRLRELPVGTRLRIGGAEIRATQIGKECHSACGIRRIVGRCAMPTEGIFAEVVRGGTVRPGDPVEVLEGDGDDGSGVRADGQ